MRVLLLGLTLGVLIGSGAVRGAAGQEAAKSAPIPNASVRTAPATEPVALEAGPHLLIDEYVIARAEHLTRTTHAPVRSESNPILGWEQGTTQPYMTVLQDPDTKRFRMWYNRGIGEPCAIAYAESEDGIHWQTPAIEGRADNIVFAIPSGFSVGVIDDGPTGADPAQRYKLAWWGRNPPGCHVAFSPDGLHWNPFEGNPVLPDFCADQFVGDPRVPYSVSDVIEVYRDPIRARYAGFFKSSAVEADGYAGGPRAGSMYRRLVNASWSADFVHWEKPWRVLVPEARDPGLLEFYSVGGTFARGGLLIGFARMLHDDFSPEPEGSGEGVGYSALVTSRDGVHWQRHDGIFLDRSPFPGAWDRAMAWISSVVRVDDEYFIYYGGYKRGHKVEPTKERQLGLARLALDRFVSRDAFGDTPGKLVTVPFSHGELSGKRLTLNVAATGGLVRVQMLDMEGVPVPGCTFADTRAVNGNGVALPVPDLDLAKAGDQLVRLEFEIRNAQLFAFGLAQ